MCYTVAALPWFASEHIRTAASVRRWILINDARFPFSLQSSPEQQQQQQRYTGLLKKFIDNTMKIVGNS